MAAELVPEKRVEIGLPDLRVLHTLVSQAAGFGHGALHMLCYHRKFKAVEILSTGKSEISFSVKSC